jgi:hypothetical protein
MRPSASGIRFQQSRAAMMPSRTGGAPERAAVPGPMLVSEPFASREQVAAVATA